MNKIKKFFKLIQKPRLLCSLPSMGANGYLYEIGWINSFQNKMPMNKSGAPFPWVTYSFIDYISSRLKLDMDIFEYGSGNSTL